MALTRRMRAMVQQDADALGLGIDVVGFTVGGMHPPVPVATDYEAVVSAELGKVTAVANAQAFRNQTVPAAEASALTAKTRRGQTARKRLAGQRARHGVFARWNHSIALRHRNISSGAVWRCWKTALPGRHFTVVDSRFQRDGGELWLIP